MKPRKVQYTLIPAQGADEITFDFFEPDNLKSNIESIEETHLKNLKSLDSIQSFRIVLNQSKEYLLKIIENSSYKKLLKETLSVSKEELNLSAENQKNLTLDQKITNKRTINSPKPKI